MAQTKGLTRLLNPMGVIGGMGAAAKAFAQGQGVQGAGKVFWTFTTDYYVPNKQQFQVDGGRYGARYDAVTEIERAQEFSIAVNAIAREIGGAKRMLEMETQGQDPVPLTDRNHPLVKLMEQPNPLHTWQSFIETSVMLLLPTGNCYWLMDPLSAAGTPMAIWILRPDRTRPVRLADPVRPVQGYEHFAEDGTRHMFPSDRVIHIKLPNPLTDYQGLGLVQTLGLTLEMDVSSMQSNINLFRQGGRLSTVIEGYDDGDPLAEKEFVNKIKASHMGSENAHKVLILHGNAKLNTRASAATKEVDYKTTREDLSRATGGMMGVPPLMMGQLDQINRSTATVQQQQFNKNAVWPHMNRFEPALNIIARKFGPYAFRFPRTDALDTDTAYNYIFHGSQSGALSPNDTREKFLGLARSKDPDMDKFYILNTYIPLDTSGKQPVPASSLPAAMPGAAPADAVAKPAVTPHVPATPTAPPHKGPLTSLSSLGSKALTDKDGRPFPKGTQEQRRVLAAVRATRPKIDKALAAPIERHFRAIADKAVAELEKRGKGKAVQKASIPGLLDGICKAYDPTGTSSGLQQDAGSVYAAQVVSATQDAAIIFGISMDGFDESSTDFANVQQYLAQRITGVDQQVKDQIASLMQQGAEMGLSPWQIANGTTPAWSEANDGASFDGIRNMADDIAQERAMLIARTETAHLQDAVNLEAYKRMGVTACDVLGCEDFKVMTEWGQSYGCNSQNVPISAQPIQFHPNHAGAVVPRPVS